MQTTPTKELDPIKIHSAAHSALVAVMDHPVSLHEAHAALIAAAFNVHQAIESQQKLSIAQRVLAAIRGPK